MPYNPIHFDTAFNQYCVHVHSCIFCEIATANASEWGLLRGKKPYKFGYQFEIANLINWPTIRDATIHVFSKPFNWNGMSVFYGNKEMKIIEIIISYFTTEAFLCIVLLIKFCLWFCLFNRCFDGASWSHCFTISTALPNFIDTDALNLLNVFLLNGFMFILLKW